MSDKPLSYYLKESKNLNPQTGNNVKKIAILGNYTLEGLANIIRVISNENNFYVKIYESQYNQYRQEIINVNSGWYKFKPHLSFIILDFDSLIGEKQFEFYTLTDEKRKEIIIQTSEELRKIIKLALTQQDGKLVISNFPIPTFSPYGIYDSKTKFTMKDFVNSLNETIKQMSFENASLYVLELDVIVQRHGKLNVTDEKMVFLADMKISPSFLPKFAKYLMHFIKPLFGKTKKCLVLDLDNSLWGGIIGEDGLEGIKLDNKPPGNAFLEFQKVVLEFYHRGIILAINSKNNVDDVKEVFNNHPNMILKEKHFASICINWADKVNNLISIAQDLNIGVDSLVFWDDDPVNRAFVKQQLPEVMVVEVPNDPSLYANTLRNLDAFNSFQITKEDKKKGLMYASQLQRKSFEKQFTNIDKFLASLNMEVSIKKAEQFTIPRISQLTMKTNQFNLTTKRYSEEEITNMTKSNKFLIRTFSVKDKFGDNGLTGIYIVKKVNNKRWELDAFLMSCRIMGRNIEKVMINDLIENSRKENIQELIGHYYPTKKNQVVKELLSNFKFLPINENDFIIKIPSYEKLETSYIKT